MDVILDANVILEDLVFERAQFGELFAYLKRTSSRLAIPTVVRDEVEARFREQLSKQISIARRAWEHVRKLSGASNPVMPSVDVDAAVKLLRTRMLHPAQGVLESVFLELHSVDLNDVVQRGIHRRKPASETGEELRDVVVWLVVKQYAKEKSSEIAFISRDGGFRVSKDSHELHPELRTELSVTGLSVSYHPDIAGFITTHALTERSVSDSWLSQFLRLADLRSVATGMLLAKGATYGIVQHAEIDSLELSKATEYQITPNSSYLEASYKGTGTLRLTPNLFSMNPGGTQAEMNNLLTYERAGGSLQFSGYSQGLIGLYSPILQPFVFDTSFPNMLSEPSVTTVQSPSPENRKCIFTLGVSGRINNGEMVAGQIDDLQIQHMSSLIVSD